MGLLSDGRLQEGWMPEKRNGEAYSIRGEVIRVVTNHQDCRDLDTLDRYKT